MYSDKATTPENQKREDPVKYENKYLLPVTSVMVSKLTHNPPENTFCNNNRQIG